MDIFVMDNGKVSRILHLLLIISMIIAIFLPRENMAQMIKKKRPRGGGGGGPLKFLRKAAEKFLDKRKATGRNSVKFGYRLPQQSYALFNHPVSQRPQFFKSPREPRPKIHVRKPHLSSRPKSAPLRLRPAPTSVSSKPAPAVLSSVRRPLRLRPRPQPQPQPQPQLQPRPQQQPPPPLPQSEQLAFRPVQIRQTPPTRHVFDGDFEHDFLRVSPVNVKEVHHGGFIPIANPYQASTSASALARSAMRRSRQSRRLPLSAQNVPSTQTLLSKTDEANAQLAVDDADVKSYVGAILSNDFAVFQRMSRKEKEAAVRAVRAKVAHSFGFSSIFPCAVNADSGQADLDVSKAFPLCEGARLGSCEVQDDAGGKDNEIGIESLDRAEEEANAKMALFGTCLRDRYPAKLAKLPIASAWTTKDSNDQQHHHQQPLQQKQKQPHFESDADCTEFVHIFFPRCKRYVRSCSALQKDPDTALPVIGCLFSRYPELMLPLL